MSSIPNLVAARRDGLVVQELADEVLVYDLKSHQAHCLNQTAAFVWNHCDGQSQTTEIAALMEKEWRKPIGEEVVWLALKQLNQANLLQSPLVNPAGETRVSRRAVMRKLGLAAAVALPLVTSVLAPTAASAAATGVVPPVCVPCTIFGSGSNRTNTCPAQCDATVIGTCYNNSSCNGVGGQFPNTSCNLCFSANPTSSSWRAL